MKMIKHKPIFDVEKVIKHYTERDGVPVVYVCTSDVLTSDNPKDIFYRADGSSHPEFGNRYFGLAMDRSGSIWISNADRIESLEFGMVADSSGDLHYSQSHHDYKVLDNGKMIDGGRVYIRSNGCSVVMKVKDGILTAIDEVDTASIDNKNIIMSSN
jgi:hypothetical protein